MRLKLKSLIFYLNLMIIIFLFIFSAILLSGHFFLYFSLINFLNIVSPNVKIWIGGVFLFLSFSFVLSSILAHYSEGVFARLFYSVFSFWLGVGWNLTMAFFISWLIVGLSKIGGFDFDYKYLVIGSVAFALFISIWGAWNAYNPKVKNVTVKIKNLPQEWENKKIIQLSDVHLGHIYGEKFITQIVEKVNQEKPDIVFITGDLFDGMDGELEYLANPLKNINAKDGIYFVTGNHETYLGVSRAKAALKDTAVRTLEDELVNLDGMQIIGISYPERSAQDSIVSKFEKLKNFNPQGPSVLLYHNPASAKEAKDLGVSLQLAGHSHRGQIFPFGLITYWVYGQYHNGLTEEGDFSIYTSAGTGTWGPMMRTSGRSEIVVLNFKNKN